MVDAKVIGVVQLFNRFEDMDPSRLAPFTTQDLKVTQSWAKKVAIGIAKMLHIERANNKMKHLVTTKNKEKALVVIGLVLMKVMP